MILSKYGISGALCCSRGGGKPPSDFQPQASLLNDKANYLLITVLQDTSDMGEAEQLAAHCQKSSLPGLFLELFLWKPLMEPM